MKETVWQVIGRLCTAGLYFYIMYSATEYIQKEEDIKSFLSLMIPMLISLLWLINIMKEAGYYDKEEKQEKIKT